MKTSAIAKQYGFNLQDFEKFLRIERFKLIYGIGSISIDDKEVSSAVEKYREYKRTGATTNIIADGETTDEDTDDAEREAAIANILITSGFNFDGYRVVKYSGYISGDDAVSVNRGYAIFGSGGNVKDKLMNSLVQIRRNALRELKEAAYDLGCNAVIGVDFDYLTLDPQTANLAGGTTYQPYVFGVTANGNAVIIEKIED